MRNRQNEEVFRRKLAEAIVEMGDNTTEEWNRLRGIAGEMFLEASPFDVRLAITDDMDLLKSYPPYVANGVKHWENGKFRIEISDWGGLGKVFEGNFFDFQERYGAADWKSVVAFALSKGFVILPAHLPARYPSTSARKPEKSFTCIVDLGAWS